MNSSPVSRGQLIELNIYDLNNKGEGVGRYHGFTVFVPGTAAGDQVTASVLSVQKTYARALLHSVLHASDCRVTPPCVHHGACGGCQLQHLAYNEQLGLKRRLVATALQRLAGLDLAVQPVLGMADPWRYRNKAQIPVGSANGAVVTGFYAPRSHRIISMDSCLLQHPANDRAILAVREALQALAIPIYDETSHTGLVRHIMVRTSFTTGKTLLVLATNGRQLPESKQLVKMLSVSLGNLAGIVQNINTRRGNVILGNEEQLLCGLPYLEEKLGGLTFRVSSRSFLQVNTLQAEVLYAKVREYAALTGRETVFDLYCGAGTIGLYLSRQAKKVVGVEAISSAVTDARANAQINNIANTEFLQAQAEELVPKLLAGGYRAGVVVIDPPRKGCDAKLLATLTEMRPRRLIYVSCDPATLARDLRYLTNHGFAVREVQPVDMFPHTSHVETVVLMSRVEK
ncbi:MAG: 23S rRNA (uracil-C(5))-methyltransferase RlmCD [Syntrophomonadaceae bacterium]|nr:23S rRNA (uracil-C(5))-methyltransferase RlmCD [Bacillota bacterium]